MGQFVTLADSFVFVLPLELNFVEPHSALHLFRPPRLPFESTSRDLPQRILLEYYIDPISFRY